MVAGETWPVVVGACSPACSHLGGVGIRELRLEAEAEAEAGVTFKGQLLGCTI